MQIFQCHFYMMLMMQMILITNMGCYSSTHLTRISTPRFLCKKRGKGYNGLWRSSKAHHDLFSWEGWSMISWNFISFLRAKGKREQLWKDGSSQILSISWSTHGMSVRNISWANKHETPDVWEGMGKFQIWFTKSWVHLSYTRKP
jgi:hypothetical protein